MRFIPTGHIQITYSNRGPGRERLTLTLDTVVISILWHGVSVRPLMKRRERHEKAAPCRNRAYASLPVLPVRLIGPTSSMR